VLGEKYLFTQFFFYVINTSGRDKASEKDVYLLVSICKHARPRAPMSYMCRYTYSLRHYRVVFARDARHGRPDGHYLSISTAWNIACNERYYYYYSSYH